MEKEQLTLGEIEKLVGQATWNSYGIDIPIREGYGLFCEDIGKHYEKNTHLRGKIKINHQGSDGKSCVDIDGDAITCDEVSLDIKLCTYDINNGGLFRKKTTTKMFEYQIRCIRQYDTERWRDCKESLADYTILFCPEEKSLDETKEALRQYNGRASKNEYEKIAFTNLTSASDPNRPILSRIYDLALQMAIEQKEKEEKRSFDYQKRRLDDAMNTVKGLIKGD